MADLHGRGGIGSCLVQGNGTLLCYPWLELGGRWNRVHDGV